MVLVKCGELPAPGKTYRVYLNVDHMKNKWYLRVTHTYHKSNQHFRVGTYESKEAAMKVLETFDPTNPKKGRSKPGTVDRYSNGMWRVRVRYRGEGLHVGYFEDEKQAHLQLQKVLNDDVYLEGRYLSLLAKRSKRKKVRELRKRKREGGVGDDQHMSNRQRVVGPFEHLFTKEDAVQEDAVQEVPITVKLESNCPYLRRVKKERERSKDDYSDKRSPKASLLEQNFTTGDRVKSISNCYGRNGEKIYSGAVYMVDVVHPTYTELYPEFNSEYRKSVKQEDYFRFKIQKKTIAQGTLVVIRHLKEHGWTYLNGKEGIIMNAAINEQGRWDVKVLSSGDIYPFLPENLMHQSKKVSFTIGEKVKMKDYYDNTWSMGIVTSLDPVKVRPEWNPFAIIGTMWDQIKKNTDLPDPMCMDLVADKFTVPLPPSNDFFSSNATSTTGALASESAIDDLSTFFDNDKFLDSSTFQEVSTMLQQSPEFWLDPPMKRTLHTIHSNLNRKDHGHGVECRCGKTPASGLNNDNATGQYKSGLSYSKKDVVRKNTQRPITDFVTPTDFTHKKDPATM